MQFTGDMSFSAWEVFDNCRARFAFEKIMKEPTKDKAFFVKGRATHKHLESVIRDGAPIDPTMAPKENAVILEIQRSQAAKSVEEKWGFDRYWNVVPYGKAALRVIIDVRLDYHDTMEVVDWKTGQKRGQSIDQMSLSATATFHRYPVIEEVTTRLVYVEKGGQTISDHYRRDLVTMTQLWESRFVEVYREREWLATPNEWCRFCDFARSKGGKCRYG